MILYAMKKTIQEYPLPVPLRNTEHLKKAGEVLSSQVSDRMMAWGVKGIMVNGVPGLLAAHFESRLTFFLPDLPAGKLKETGERLRKQIYAFYKSDPEMKPLLDCYFAENPVAVFDTLTDRSIMGVLNGAEPTIQYQMSLPPELQILRGKCPEDQIPYMLNRCTPVKKDGVTYRFTYSIADHFKELLHIRYASYHSPVKKPAPIQTLVEESATIKNTPIRSYLISVSLGKGCYRHIQISAKSTLADLSNAILEAFAFDNDHLHAFFMDNQAWSHRDAYWAMPDEPGERCTGDYSLRKLKLRKDKKFLYLFDYGDSWEFSCKVLRELTVDTLKAQIIRSVGVPPEQYPQWDEEDWLSEDEIQILEQSFAPLKALFEQMTSDERESVLTEMYAGVAELHDYCVAVARVYGILTVRELFQLYNTHNAPLDEDTFLMKLALVIDGSDANFEILGQEDIYNTDTDTDLMDMEIISSQLLAGDTIMYERLKEAQSGRSMKPFPKAELLAYADVDYYPTTAQQTAMQEWLQLRKSSMKRLPDEEVMILQDLARYDGSMELALKCMKEDGLQINSDRELQEFLTLWANLNNHTIKRCLRGYTPAELSGADAPLPIIQVQPGTVKGTPPRNGPCPCGSGRKYKNCCGKK